MYIKFALVDDEASIRSLYASYLKEWAELSGRKIKIMEYRSAESFFFDYLDQRDFDLVLLDIEMNGMSGVDLAKKLRQENDQVQIIFISGYGEYIGYGYDVDALNFLIKPIKKERLFTVLDKSLEKAGNLDKSILIRSDNESYKIYLKDIVCLSADKNYVNIEAKDKTYRARATLKDMEEMLDDRFFRLSRSDLINIECIESMDKERVLMEGDRIIYIPRGRFADLNKKIIDYY